MTEENGAAKTEEAQAPTRIDETAGLLTASLDSMTPAIAQRLMATAAKLGELVDLVEIINIDEMKELVVAASQAADSLSRSLAAVKELEESGALTSLVELAGLASSVRASMTTPIVARTLSTGVSLAVAGDQMLEAVHDSVNESKKDTRKLGPMALLSELKDPQVQESLKFLLSFAKRIPGILDEF